MRQLLLVSTLCEPRCPWWIPGREHGRALVPARGNAALVGLSARGAHAARAGPGRHDQQ